MIPKRRNSALDGIEEENSKEFSKDLLNLEFRDSDDESISLSLNDAMVGDEELHMEMSGPPSASIGEEASVAEDYEEEEAPPPAGRDKSITEQIQKRTGRFKIITWGLLFLLSLVAILTSYFITRGEDCDEKREEVSRVQYLPSCQQSLLTNALTLFPVV